MMLNAIQFPASNDVATRIEWAGERAWDIAEGKLNHEQGVLVWNVVVGWMDLCSDVDREQYRSMASQISGVLQAA